jgi:hypothetical protein
MAITGEITVPLMLKRGRAFRPSSQWKDEAVLSSAIWRADVLWHKQIGLSGTVRLDRHRIDQGRVLGVRARAVHPLGHRPSLQQILVVAQLEHYY